MGSLPSMRQKQQSPRFPHSIVLRTQFYSNKTRYLSACPLAGPGAAGGQQPCLCCLFPALFLLCSGGDNCNSQHPERFREVDKDAGYEARLVRPHSALSFQLRDFRQVVYLLCVSFASQVGDEIRPGLTGLW